MKNINHIKKSSLLKVVKENYYDVGLLENEFEDFLEHHQMFMKKDTIERHIKDKNNQGINQFILRKEMKYLDELFAHKEEQLKK
jgi:hypothetical protein